MPSSRKTRDSGAADKVAIRFIRAHADAYNVDPRYIGGWGHSKGAYAITRLSDPKHAERGAEHQRLEGKPEGSPEPQPWPGYSSRIAAGYQSMGNGTRRSAQYVTEDYAPNIVACGEFDHFNHWLDLPRVVDAYEHANANHVALGMLGLGHELPYGRDDEFGGDQSRWSNSLPEILARGYALAIIDREGIDPDEDDGFKNGVHGAFDPPGDRPADAWGTISAWAWGLSRALDYLETDDDVDHARIAVMGVSREGKTALWAGAQDQRFAMTISICSGAGGAALSRRRYGNPNDVMNDRHPHWKDK